MTILRDVQKLLTIVEHLHPRVTSSAVYRVAAKRALHAAVMAETKYDDGDTIAEPAKGSLEDEQCQDPGTQEASTNALNDTLREHLRRPLRGTSRSSKAKTNVVSLSASKRLPPT
jgi:hypothetical protein